MGAAAAKVEEIQRQREERRRKAEEMKNKRAEEARDAEDRGGIEAVDFLNQIVAYRAAHSIPDEPSPWDGGNVWEDAAVSSSQIRVCVRKRPMLKVEQLKHDFDVVCAEESHASLVVLEPKTKVDLTKQIDAHRFTFDAVFNEGDGNDAIYGATLAPLLAHVFGGGFATVFAFGQTGSGKTCTMAGHGNYQAMDGNAAGLYKLAAHDITAFASRRSDVEIGVSFFEVYRGQVLDLLGERARLEVLEDGRGRVRWWGCGAPHHQADELLELVRQAEELRAVGATSANGSRRAARDPAGDATRGGLMGKMSLVDLAGSSARPTALQERQTRIEGAEINKPPVPQGVRPLARRGSNTPFRGSKLTQVLRDRMGGEDRHDRDRLARLLRRREHPQHAPLRPARQGVLRSSRPPPTAASRPRCRRGPRRPAGWRRAAQRRPRPRGPAPQPRPPVPEPPAEAPTGPAADAQRPSRSRLGGGRPEAAPGGALPPRRDAAAGVARRRRR